MSRVPSRGIEYRIDFRVGRSASSVRSLTEALRELNIQTRATQQAFGATNPQQELYANSIATLAAALNQLRTILPQMNNMLAQQTAQVNAAAAAQANMANQTQRNAAAQTSWQRGMANLAFQQNPWNRGMAQLNWQRQQAAQLAAQQAQAAASTAAMTAQVRAQVNAIGQAQTGLQGLLAAFGTFTAMVGAGRVYDFITEVTMLAGRIENLDTVMKAVGQTNNVTAGQMYLTQDAMKKLGITTQVSREIIARFAQNNLDMADSLKIARIAQDAAVVAGLNSSETAERMMIAVQRLDTRMLRNVGILVNLRNEYQKVAIATGRYENSLTAAEKQEIVMQAVIRAGAALAGTYEKSLQDVYKQWTSLDRKIEEAKKTLGDNFLPAFRIFVQLFDGFLESITATNGYMATFLTIALGSVAAVTALAAALGAAATAAWFLNAAFIANPLLAVAATVWAVVSAIGGGLVAAMLAWVSASERANKQMEITAQKTAYEKVRIAELAGDIERLAAIKNRSDMQEMELLDAKREALSLYGQSKDKDIQRTLRQAKTTQEFLNILRNSEKFGMPATWDDDLVLSRLGDEAKKKQAALDAMNEARENSWFWVGDEGGDPGGVAVTIERWLLGMGELEQEAKKAKLDFESLETAINQIKLKNFDKMGRDLDNLDRVVRSAKKSIEDSQIGNFSEGGKDMLKRIDILRDLSAAHITAAQIEEEYRIAVREAEKQKNADIEKIKKDAPEDKQEEQIAEREAAFLVRKTQLHGDMNGKLQQYNELMQSAKVLEQENARAIEDMAFAHAKYNYVSQMSEKGLGTFAEKLVSLSEEARKYGQAVQGWNNQIAQQQTAIDGLQKRVDSNDPMRDVGGRDAAMATLEQMKKNLQALKDAAADTLPTFADIVDKAMNDLVENAGAGSKAMTELRLATEKMKTESELLGMGIDSNLVSALMQADEESRKYSETQDKLAQQYTELQKQMAMMIAMQAAMGAFADPSMQVQIDALAEASQKIKDAVTSQDAFRVEQEKATQAKIADIKAKSLAEQLQREKDDVQKSYKELGKIKADASKKIADIDNDVAERTEKTGDSIRRRGLEFRKKFSGLLGNPQDAMVADVLLQGDDFFKSIRDDVAGAGNVRQVTGPGGLSDQWKQQMAVSEQLIRQQNNGQLPREYMLAKREWERQLNDATQKLQQKLADEAAEKQRQQQMLAAAEASAKSLATIEAIMSATPGSARGGLLAGVQNAMTPSDLAIQMAAGTMPAMGGIGGGMMGGVAYQTMLNSLLNPAQKAANAQQGMADAAKSAAGVVADGMEKIEQFSNAATIAITKIREATAKTDKAVSASLKAQGLK